jgi:hypothetical protein
VPPEHAGRITGVPPKDNTSSTIDVNFTVEQLQALEPEKVHYFGGFDEKSQRDRYTTGTPNRFKGGLQGLSNRYV